MGMVAVEHFRSAMHQPELGRIAHVGTGNRRGGVAEGIGAIPHRLILEAEVLVLHMHVVDPERLAAIVDRAATRTIGICQRITLWQEVALLVDGAEGFVADFVIHQNEFPKIWTGSILDDRPASRWSLV